MSFDTGHIKRDPDTGAVAIRTIFPEDQGQQLANMAWLIGTPNIGARHAPTGDVELWDDLYVPEPAADPVEAPADPPADPPA